MTLTLTKRADILNNFLTTPPPKKWINDHISSIATLSYEELLAQRDAINKLFFTVLPSYDYDRSLIAKQGALEHVLNPELYEAHDNNQDIDQASGKPIKETLLEAQFALRLGISPEPIRSTSNRTYKILDRFGNPLGVFKEQDKQLPYTQFFLVKKTDDIYRILKGDSYGATTSLEHHLNDVAVSHIDTMLGTHVVPYTTLFDIETHGSSKRHGSFQLYIEAPTLGSQLNIPNIWADDLTLIQNLQNNTPLQVVNFENYSLLDMLVGNNDAHFQNALLCSENNNQHRLVAIDNSNSFPWSTDKELHWYRKTPNHTHKWKVLPQAQYPYSRDTISRIQNLNLPKIINQLHKDLVDPRIPSSSEKIQDKIKALEARYSIICTKAVEGATISDIAKSIIDMRINPTMYESMTTIFNQCCDMFSFLMHPLRSYAK